MIKETEEQVEELDRYKGGNSGWVTRRERIFSV